MLYDEHAYVHHTQVHVKLGMRAAEFIPAYDVMVADIVDTSKVMSTADDD